MDLDALNLKKLRAFHLVARYGNLRSAAMRLNVTVSAVSFSIRRLEEGLGIQLFDRLPNKLVLTAAGQRFADSADAIFEGIDQALADSALDVASVSRMSLAVNSDLVSYFIPRISHFLKRYPDIELRIHIQRSSSALRMIEHGEIDVAIGHFVGVPNNVEIQPIVESSISLVCRRDHPLARKRQVRLKDLSKEKLVTLPLSHPTRSAIDNAFVNAGERMHSFIEVGNCQTIINVVDAGIGIGLVHSLCTSRADSSDLHVARLQRHFGKLVFSMVHQKELGVSPMLLGILKESLVAP